MPRLVMLALVLGLAGCAAGDEPAAPGPRGPRRVVVQLTERNHSAQVGTATLTPSGDRYDVLLQVSYPVRFEGGRQRGHVHDVTCDEYARMGDPVARVSSVVATLEPLFGSESKTRVRRDRLALGRSIDVHAGVEPQTVVACGDIPNR